jgi:diguanylate cyclase (GGDEF)-like protein
MLDVAMIAVVARRLLSRDGRDPSALLLATGLAAFTLADIVYAGATLDGRYATGNPIDAGWLIGYVLIAASALHPSMRREAAVTPPADEPLGRARVAMIVVALVVAIVALVEIPLRRADDVVVSLTGALLLVGLVVARLVGALRRSGRLLSEATVLRSELAVQASIDALTGLPNRAAFLARVDAALAAEGGTVAFLDLDGFKQVNDGFGHGVGDALLAACGQRLQGVLRTDDMLARLGGDEFAVLLPVGTGDDGARVIAGRMLDALDAPVMIDGTSVRVTASVGLAHAGRGASASSLLREADVAMYEAKRRGGGCVERFDTGAHAGVMRGYRTASELPRALERDEMELEYQPIVELPSHRVVALEALLRWRHPEEGLLPPQRFIPIAERSDLIAALDRWALGESARQIARWRSDDVAAAALPVHVNLSAQGLGAAHAAEAARIVRAAYVDPARIILEVTETAPLERRGAREALDALRAVGFRLALDDFGTRYSVLAGLAELPFDRIKLDRSFVASADDGRRVRFLAGIVRLLEDLGVDVVAEGIETEAEERVASCAGVRLAQGFRFARPMSTHAIARLVKADATSQLGALQVSAAVG